MHTPLVRRNFLQRLGLGVAGAVSSLPLTARAGRAAAGTQQSATTRKSKNAAIRLVIRGDDMGIAQAVNEACIRVCRYGVVRSLEVMAPGAWFPDAVRLLREHPKIDVGVHLTLTSEWERIKWRPLTPAPSLLDPDGYFLPGTSQGADSPPHTGLLQARYNPDEVERELRAQVEMVKRHLPGRVSHVSFHMSAAIASPVLRAVTTKLAREQGLGMEYPNLKDTRSWSGIHLSGAQKEHGLIQLLESLPPGDWMTLEHPGLNTPEMRNIFHHRYKNVAEDRAGVTQAFTSPRVQEVIKRRGIQLISYAEL